MQMFKIKVKGFYFESTRQNESIFATKNNDKAHILHKSMYLIFFKNTEIYKKHI